MLKIANGTVYDPANGIDGVVMDLWIQDGKIVAPPIDAAVHPDRITRRNGAGRHARRRRHALAHRRAEGERGPQDEARGQTARPARAALGPDPLRHGRQRAQHLRHRLPLRRARLHHRLRRRHSAPGRPACSRGVSRHAHDRQGLFHPAGQQSLRHEADRQERPGPAAGVRRLDACMQPRAYAIKLVNPGGVEAWKQGAQHRRARR